jgi:hypothetical protein
MTLKPILVAAVAAVVPPPTTQPSTPGLPTSLPRLNRVADKISEAQGGESWAEKTAVAADITLEFTDQDPIKGRLTFEIEGGRSRIEIENGTTLVFDGSKAWVSPADAEFDWARFYLRMWPYLLAAPFKLDDPGVTVGPLVSKVLDGEIRRSARVTFKSGTGDTPDDWYQLFLDRETDRLASMGYIMTYGRTVAEAESRARMIKYESFSKVDGVSLASKWTLLEWNPKTDKTGAEVGTAKVSDIEFLKPKSNTFEKPEDAREDPRP